jgi:trimeric autotransporter adhesin
LQGLVKSGNIPMPGATVTATNSASGRKIVVWTQVDGSYKLALPSEGEYSVRVQMVAFAPDTQRVTVSATNSNPRLNLQLTLLSRAQSSGGTYARGTGGAMRGYQTLSAMQAEVEGGSSNNGGESVVPAGMPVPGIPSSIATESVAVSGSNSPSMSGMSSDEMRQRFQDNRSQQGGIPGAAGGPGGGPGGGGGFGGPGGGPGGGGGGGVMLRGGRGVNFNQPHGTIYYSANDSVFNAAPYSLTGQPISNPAYLQQRFGAAIGGPLNIPHIYHGGSKTFFFLHYNGTLGETPYSAFSTVPTELERSGNFSQTTVNGQSVQIFNPLTGLPFANATVPQNMISSSAKSLLNYIPLPNLPGTSQNFQYVTAATSNSNDLNVRINQALGNGSSTPGQGRRRGPQNNLNFGLHYHNADSTLTSPFPSVGGKTTTSGLDVPVGYVRSFGKLINTFRVDFNRSTITTNNLYAFVTDVAGAAGINGVSQDPLNWGIPNLSFTHFGSINDVTPVKDRNQTITFTDQMIETRGKHTLRWGGDFRLIQINTETSSDPRGSFVFTGAATAQMVNGVPVTGTGYDFADFLLGLPQQTAVQYGSSPSGYHFRGNSWDLYAQDEWRARGNLTLNIGLRYEYVSPLSEINNQIVNLDTNPGFTAVAPVFPNQVGSLSGIYYPLTLVKPDRNNFAPRVGFAWKMKANTVIRGGYGINYNTTAYQNMVQDLAFQPPFSFTQTNVSSATLPLTLTNGFPTPPPGSVTNNYGVNPYYRLGYVQIWNLDLQQEISRTLVLNLDYTGTKGTDLDVLEAPNRTPTGIRIPGVAPFYWENSGADSNANAGSIRLRKRLATGVSLGGTFTWSKSLDDASTIGAGSALVSPTGTVVGQVSVAQNPFDLAAERGLSSFNQEFRFTGDWLWEIPAGKGRQWLASPGLAQDFFGNWQWSGDWTIASGFPFTPRILGSFSDVNSGVNGTLRPDVTGVPVALSNPSIGEWFNVLAFTQPPTGQYGDARRNSIVGPGEAVVDMAMTKLITLKESKTLELRFSATNVFNHPVYTAIDTTLNSPTFGRVISVGAMRSALITARFRF